MTASLKFHSTTRRARPEAQLQKCVIQHLMLTGAPNMLYFSIPNEGRRSPRGAAELKRMGMRPGVADLCVIVDGRAFFMEFKAKGKKQTDVQKQFERDCAHVGVDCTMVDNITDALHTLRHWNAIGKASWRKA